MDTKTGATDGYCGHWSAGAMVPQQARCTSCCDKDREIALLRAILNGLRYRDALGFLGVPETDYHPTMAFLKRHECLVDFRPFRKPHQ